MPIAQTNLIGYGKWWQTILLALLTLVLTLTPLSGTTQVFNTNDSEAAPVIFNGRVLFQVRKIGEFSANFRANSISETLAKEAKEKGEIDLEVVELENQGDIAIVRSRRSDRHLVTVTSEDVRLGSTALQQAKDWQEDIEKALIKSQEEQAPGYPNRALLLSGGILLGGMVVSSFLFWLQSWLSPLLMHWLGQPNSSIYQWQQPIRMIVQLAIVGVQVGLWISISIFIVDLFPQARIARHNFFQFIDYPFVRLGEDHAYSVLQILLLISFSVGLWFAVNTITKLFKSYILAKSGAHQSIQEVFTVLAKYLLIFLGLVILLEIWGFDVSSLTLLGGVLGVGIGFGVQNIANNFISGIIIVVERPIQVGDFIKLGELVGTVKHIGARSTEIVTLDRVSIIVPNSRFLDNEVINWNHGDSVSRLRIPVGVAHGSNIKLVKKVLIEAAKSHQDVLLRPRPQVWFQEFGESALQFDLLVWTGEPKKQPRIKSDLNYRIESALRKNGIQVPFPQRDFHLRSYELERFVNAWLRQNQPDLLKNPYSDGSQPTMKDPWSVNTVIEDNSPITELQDDDNSDVDVEEVASQMRGKGGVEICDRTFRFQIYSECFVGSEAVDWLVTNYEYSRKEAVKVGQMLKDRGIIHHVTDDHNFKDEYLFYRFYADENRRK